MFKLFSRSKPSPSKTDFNAVAVDMHSHLLPGIDDGSPDIQTSLKLIRGLVDLVLFKTNYNSTYYVGYVSEY